MTRNGLPKNPKTIKYYEWHLKNIFKGSFDLPRKK